MGVALTQLSEIASNNLYVMFWSVDQFSMVLQEIQFSFLKKRIKEYLSSKPIHLGVNELVSCTQTVIHFSTGIHS